MIRYDFLIAFGDSDLIGFVWSDYFDFTQIYPPLQMEMPRF